MGLKRKRENDDDQRFKQIKSDSGPRESIIDEIVGYLDDENIKALTDFPG